MNVFRPDKIMLQRYTQHKLSSPEEEKVELWLADHPPEVDFLKLDIAFVNCLVPDYLTTAERIVKSIAIGDYSAEEELVNTYTRSLMLILQRKYWRQPFLEDVIQETLASVIYSIRQNKLRSPNSLSAFIRQTALNIASRHLRYEYKHQSDIDIDSIPELPDTSTDLYNNIEQQDLLRLVGKVISQLPIERDREILLRFYYNRENKETICKVLDLTTEHFDRVLYRAKQRLKLQLDKQYPDNGNS